MPFSWSGALQGAGKGAVAGTAVSPGWGTAIGAIGGGIAGAFDKDIDKGVTGNSQSGQTQTALSLAALAGGGAMAYQNAGGMSGLFGGGNGASSAAGTMNSSLGSYYMPSGMSGVGGAGMNPLVSSSISGLGQQAASSGFGSKGLGGITKNPLLLGSGIMGASQLIRSPQVPESPQSVVDYQNAARAGNPLQNQAAAALQQQFGQTQQNLGQPEIDALNRQYDMAMQDELKSVDSMYKSLRPGTDPLTDSSYQKDISRIRDRYATLRADSVAGAQRQISNDFQSQRGQQIAQAAGLGQQQLQQLAQLSQYDLDRQLSQLNIDYQDKSTLRNYLLQLGGNIAASGYQQNPLAGLLQQKTAA